MILKSAYLITATISWMVIIYKRVSIVKVLKTLKRQSQQKSSAFLVCLNV